MKYKMTLVALGILLSALGLSSAFAQSQKDVRIKLTCMPNVTCYADYCRRVEGSAKGVIGGKSFTLSCNAENDAVSDITVVRGVADSSWGVTLDSKPRSVCNFSGTSYPIDVSCQVSSERGVGALRLVAE